MNTPTAWGPVQDVVYHLERAVTQEVGAMLFVGGDLIPEARAVLKEAGDRVQLAVKGVEALEPKTKKRKEAHAKVLKALRAAEKKGVDAAALLFREKVRAKDVTEIHAAIAAAVALELDAVNGLLDLRT